MLGGGRFDVAHAHDWIVNSLLGPASRTGTPVVLTLHDYSHVCATKRMMRQDLVCAGPAPVACLRCASAKHGPLVGPGVVVANVAGRRARRTGVASFVAVSPVVAARTGVARYSNAQVIPNFVSDDLLVDPASLDAVGPTAGSLLFVGDLSRDKGVEVLFAAYRQLPDAPPSCSPAGSCPTPPRTARPASNASA